MDIPFINNKRWLNNFGESRDRSIYDGFAIYLLHALLSKFLPNYGKFGYVNRKLLHETFTSMTKAEQKYELDCCKSYFGQYDNRQLLRSIGFNDNELESWLSMSAASPANVLSKPKSKKKNKKKKICMLFLLFCLFSLYVLDTVAKLRIFLEFFFFCIFCDYFVLFFFFLLLFFVLARRSKLLSNSVAASNLNLTMNISGSDESEDDEENDPNYNMDQDENNYDQDSNLELHRGDVSVISQAATTISEHQFMDNQGKAIDFTQKQIEDIPLDTQVSLFGFIVKVQDYHRTAVSQQQYNENKNGRYFERSFNPFNNSALIKNERVRKRMRSAASNNVGNLKKKLHLMKGELEDEVEIDVNEELVDDAAGGGRSGGRGGGRDKTRGCGRDTTRGGGRNGRRGNGKKGKQYGQKRKMKAEQLGDKEDIVTLKLPAKSKWYNTGAKGKTTRRIHFRHYIKEDLRPRVYVDLTSKRYIRVTINSEGWRYNEQLIGGQQLFTYCKCKTVNGDLVFDIVLDHPNSKKVCPDKKAWTRHHDNLAKKDLPATLYNGCLAQILQNIELDHINTDEEDNPVSRYVEFLMYSPLRDDDYYVANIDKQISDSKEFHSTENTLTLSILTRGGALQKWLDYGIIMQQCIRSNYCSANAKLRSFNFDDDRLLYNFAVFDPVANPNNGIMYRNESQMTNPDYVPMAQQLGFDKLCSICVCTIFVLQMRDCL